MIIWQIIFGAAILLVLHSYLFYPWLLQLLSLRKSQNDVFLEENQLPQVCVIMSVYNEEKILERKLDSILESDYPESKLKIVVGSDASDDATNAILETYQKRNPIIQPVFFKERMGKPAIINQLAAESKAPILIMTDAKAIFHKETIMKLARHFGNMDIGAVGGNIINESYEIDGVSIQERAFMSREILMKYREGITWGATVGVYGAIYAIRRELYTPVPPGFSVDDFFISMNVLRKHKKVILDKEAITYQEVPNLLSEEYRRKVRISTGNFRNMRYLWPELLTPFKGTSFAYISHKVIRWLGPFIFMAFMLSNIFLYNFHQFYHYTLPAFLGVLALPIIDYFLSKIGIHIVFLRFVRHFVTMNIALLHGFANNIGGIKKDVWQPTNR